MREGDPTWVDDVPPGVALMICQNRLLGYDPKNYSAEPEVAPDPAPSIPTPPAPQPTPPA